MSRLDMHRLVRAELLEARTTRTTQFTVLAGLAFAALLGFANSSIAGDPGSASAGSASFVDDVLGVSAIPAVVAVLLGVMASAGEYQHASATTTFLITPHRWRVAASTAIGSAVVGVVVAAAMVVTAASVAFPIVVAGGDSIDLFHRGAATTVASLLLTSALLGGLGAFLGTVLRSQTAALVAVCAWALVLEVVVDAVAGGGLRQWMPGGVAADLVGGRRMDVAFLVLTAWTAALGVAATFAVRGDIA